MDLFLDSESGDDAGDGSKEKPFLSIETALRISEKEVDVTLNLAPGKYTVPVEGGKKVNEIFSIPKPPISPLPPTPPGGLSEYEAGIYKALLADKATVTYDETEPVTEPLGDAKGMSRVTSTVHVNKNYGYRITVKRSYLNPPSSKAWCAETGREIKVEKL